LRRRGLHGPTLWLVLDPARDVSAYGKRNVKNVCLGNSEKMLLPPLHMNLWLIKNFLKALDNSCELFLYPRVTFPNISDSKVKNDEYFMAQKLQIYV